MPPKPDVSHHKHQKINYVAKTQFAPEYDTSPNLDLAGILQFQSIIRDLL